MNPRDRRLCKALLDALYDRDRRPAAVAELFAEVSAVMSRAECEQTLALCDARGWLTGVAGKFTGPVWAINDEGEIARRQM
jgi:hypothetical protein